MTSRRTGAVLGAAGLLLAGGCGYGGLNSLPMPGSEGRGAGSYEVLVELESAAGMEPNTRVMVSDANVGSVVSIGLDGWHAVATVRLNPDVVLPAEVTARVAQTSVLGSKHLELRGADRPTGGRLVDGARIPLARTDSYPDTEDVLASASVLLNGGGLEKVRVITAELNDALGGRETQAREVIGRLTELTSGLDGQRDSIVRALDGLDRLGGQAAGHIGVIEEALEGVPPALDVLIGERAQLTATLQSLGAFSDAATHVVDDSRDVLVENLDHLVPTFRGLADAGDALVGATGVLGSGLFPLSTYEQYFRGDYGNLFLTIDLTDRSIDDYYLSLLRATPLGIALPEGPGRGSGDRPGPVDPLRAPLAPPAPQGAAGEAPPQAGSAPPPPVPPDPVGGVPDALRDTLGGGR